MVRSSKVATPFTALFTSVPERTARSAWRPSPMLTVAVEPVTVRPSASCTATWMGGWSGCPTFPFCGWVRNPSWTADELGGAVAVAVKVTGEPESPDADAVAVCVPVSGPSVHSAWARPSGPVVVLEGESDPPPDCTCHVTCTPAAGLPSLLLTCTTSGAGSLEPACAVWLSPLTLLMVDG